jgi:hypothetical protein
MSSMRRCLAILVARTLRSDDVLACLADLFVRHVSPDHIRSDNGSEVTAQAVRNWLGRIGVKTLPFRFEPLSIMSTVDTKLRVTSEHRHRNDDFGTID